MVGALQPAAPALFDQRDEDAVDLALKRFHARDVFRVFRQERIQHRLVLAGGIEPALDADPFDQLLKSEGAADHADRAQDRGRIAENLVARTRDHIAARGRDILDEHQHRQFLFRGELADPQIDLA